MTPVGFNFLNSAIQALDLIISSTSQIPRFHEDFLCEIIQWPQLNTGNTEFNIRKQVVNKYFIMPRIEHESEEKSIPVCWLCFR